jgi:glycosyltransferase involved in cell wall biosynthesis
MKVLFVSRGTKNEGVNSLIKDQGESIKKFNIELDYFVIIYKGIFGYLFCVWKLWRHLFNNNYDIIHAHYGLSGLVAIFANWSKKRKLIVSFMGTDLMGVVGTNGKTSILGRLLVYANQRLVFRTDYVIVKSKEMASKISHKNIAIIPNGLDLNYFLPIEKSVAFKKTGWSSNFKHILFMADPKRPEKNYFLAEKALSLIDTPNIELHYLNHLPHNEVVYYYNAADVCLLSSCHEGSPNVIKEAMACNSPIVTTSVGDVVWQLGDTKGCFVTSFDPSDMAEKIKKALDFKQKTNGRNRIMELELDASNVALKIILVYNKLLEGNSK